MKIRDLIIEDFANYSKPSMFVAFPNCTFKCERECGISCCQNKKFTTTLPILNIDSKSLVDCYTHNAITKAVVCGGLEPLDSFGDLYEFIKALRAETADEIVIYTGYYEYEVVDEIMILKEFKNIIVKFGRFVPNQQPHFDNVLGIMLASDNQYAKKIS